MAFGLDDALLGWLVASAGGALLSRLRGDRAKKAMRQLVDRAVAETITEVAGHLDGRRAQHLHTLLQEHDAKLDRTAVSSIDELRAALRRWIASLEHFESGKSGYLATLGVDADRLADALTGHLAEGIRDHGRASGPLAPLADWLWRDDLDRKVDMIQQVVTGVSSGPLWRRTGGSGLPGGTPDFTGREQPLAMLAERIVAHDPARGVVAIHAVDGMAGVGKTELALRTAHYHKDRYPDGQYFINLHGYTAGGPPVDPAAALERMLRQAGLSGQDIPADLAGRTARWQALMATRRAMVLLDNALDADQVEPLLPRAAGCLVLITSRTRLADLPGARTLALDLLPQAEAVELFCRIAAGPGRILDRESVATVVEVVGRLPVAVRATAAQIGEDYTVAELASDLIAAKQRLSLTGVGGPLGPAVAAAFDTSIRQLDPSLRHAFRLLGVHPGPSVGAPQFAALADLPPLQASGILRTLARRNLLTPVDEQIGHRRWQLHDLLREYARHQAETHLDEDERATALSRLTTWYANAIAAVEHLTDISGVRGAVPTVEGLALGGPEQAKAWVTAEQDNLNAHAEHATDAHTADMCTRYGYQLYLLDQYTGAAALYHSAARVHQMIGNRHRQANALIGLAHVAHAIGDHPTASSHDRAALEITKEIGDQAGQADALIGLGHVARYFASDRPTASRYYLAALEITKEIGDQAGQADALTGLGHVARETGDNPTASSHYQEALEVYRQTGHRTRQAGALIGLGHVARFTGDYTTARRHYRAALEVARKAGTRSGQAYALVGLGAVARLTGDLPAASGNCQAALEIFQEIGNRDGQAAALTGLGHVAKVGGRHDEARDQWQQALAIVEVGGPLAESLHRKLGQLDNS